MGMGSVGKEGEPEEPKGDLENEKKESEGEEKNEEEKEFEKRTGQLASKQVSKLDQAAQVVKLITLAASIPITKAEDEERGEAESIPFEAIVVYTVCVVFLTLMLQNLWNGMSEYKELLWWLNLEVAPKLVKKRTAVKPPKEKNPPKTSTLRLRRGPLV